MELIYIIAAFVLGVIFHKGAAALWAKWKTPLANEVSSIETKFVSTPPASVPPVPSGPVAAPPPPAPTVPNS